MFINGADIKVEKVGMSLVFSVLNVGDIMRFNIEKGDITYLDNFNKLSSGRFEQIEAFCLDFMNKYEKDSSIYRG